MRHKTVKLDSKFEYPKNVEELEKILTHVHNLRFCFGGPLLSDTELLTSPVAERGEYTKRWRHNDCTVSLTSNGECCTKCYSLYTCFKRKMINRATGAKKTLRNGSPEEYARTIGMENRRLRAKNLRLESVVEQLRATEKELLDNLHKLQAIDDLELLKLQLEKEKVASEQVFNKIFECFKKNATAVGFPINITVN